MKFSRIATIGLILFLCVIIFQLQRKLPIEKAKGFYQAIADNRDYYEAAFDYLKPGTYYYKTKSYFENGTYEAVGNNSYVLTPGNFTKIVTLTESGFVIFDKEQNSEVFIKRIGNIPGWIHQPGDKDLDIPEEYFK